MAEEIVLNTRIDTQGSEKTIGQIKQEYNDLIKLVNTTKEGTKEYHDALIRLGDAKGVMKDLKENIIALDPEKRIAAVAKIGTTIASGFAAGQAAVALFGSESEDMARVMVKVQAAMALAQGLQGLAGFAKSLEVARIAMIAFAASNPFTAIAAAVGILATAIAAFVISTDESAKALDRLNKEAEEFEEISQRTERFWERRLRLLKAQGATIEEIAINQRQAFKQELEDIENQIKTAQALIDAGDDEGIQKRSAAEDKKKEILLQSQIFELKVIDDIAEREGKRWDEKEERRLKQEAKEKEAIRERARVLKEEFDAFQKDLDDRVNARSLYTKALIEEQEREMAVKASSIELLEKERIEEEARAENKKKTSIEIAKKDLELQQSVYDTKLSMSIQSFGALASIASAFSLESEEMAEEAFNLNKAASIAQALISTYQGANAIFASAAANPSTILFPAQPFITAGLSVAAGLANVARIAKTQFKSAKPESATSTQTPTGVSSSPPTNIQSPQTFSNTTATQTQTNQQGDFQGFKQQPIKVFVTENDISNVQNRVKVIEQKNSF